MIQFPIGAKIVLYNYVTMSVPGLHYERKKKNRCPPELHRVGLTILYTNYSWKSFIAVEIIV
ncbi:hypothetical protein VN24_24885 [Paenibacillus beijingensis]|uniref:Uncharacterized protein n=1 Tax=Paenibacillus beijingensis TaxID=1126833 RepID=A0A0D5NQE0_9BACL|nr:hypothetical protein VN24_24885 [Paenibacillus beijingensis]